MNAGLAVVGEQERSSRVTGSITQGKQLEVSSCRNYSECVCLCMCLSERVFFLSFFCRPPFPQLCALALIFLSGSSSTLVWLLRNYRHQPRSLYKAGLQKAASGCRDVCGEWRVKRGNRVVTDWTPSLPVCAYILCVRVCVRSHAYLIMLTDYRFKYFKSHRAHADDGESENDCSNARD